ncbi:GntR family transcriptional regulator [Pseudactinotalea sp.]|uniref:GntR family transcriptional regulator n=1 Tax=Pseudactinotalea sp. TaxID=1926260 RepID=UPI003B3A8DF5
MDIDKSQTLDRADPRPLYVQIADQFRGRIRSNLWPAGYKFPGADVLSEDLGVARGTVRRAMRDLEQEGLIVQVHGRGTFVTAEQRPTARSDSGRVSSGERLAREGVYFETRLLERFVLEGAPSRGVFPGGRTLRIVRLRRLSEGPDAILDVELLLDRFDGLEELSDMELSAGPLHQTLKDRFGVVAARGERMYSATAADRRAASLLDVPVGSPLLAFEEFSFDAEDRCYEYTKALVRTDRHPVAVAT